MCPVDCFSATFEESPQHSHSVPVLLVFAPQEIGDAHEQTRKAGCWLSGADSWCDSGRMWQGGRKDVRLLQAPKFMSKLQGDAARIRASPGGQAQLIWHAPPCCLLKITRRLIRKAEKALRERALQDRAIGRSSPLRLLTVCIMCPGASHYHVGAGLPMFWRILFLCILPSR